MATREQFIAMLLPAAVEASKRTGVDPRIIVAQAAQETGWGRSAPGNNYFGIKSHGQGGGQNLTTHEVINGQRVKINDSFRRFESPDESVAGYADFLLKNPRYGPMRAAQGLDAQLQALGTSGYATDPNYASSVGAIARSIPIPGSLAPSSNIQIAAKEPAATAAPRTIGNAAVASAAPPQTPANNAPPPIAPAASTSSNDRLAALASLFGSMSPQTPQFSPAQIQGPSPQQATALASLVNSLKSRAFI